MAETVESNMFVNVRIPYPYWQQSVNIPFFQVMKDLSLRRGFSAKQFRCLISNWEGLRAYRFSAE